jgi:excisionase family DNA binding protein
MTNSSNSLPDDAHPGVEVAGAAISPRTYTVEQAARLLGISRTTAYECVHSGAIRSLHFRRRIVIPATVIEQLLDAERLAEHLPDGASKRVLEPR